MSCPVLRMVNGPFWLLLLVCGFCLNGMYVHAQNQRLNFRLLTMDHGLSQSIVNSVFQDHEGFLWVGTQDGLNRFDGYQFTHFKHLEDTPGTLSANEILYLTEDREGILWVGTQSGGLNRFDRNTESFTAYAHDPNNPESLSANAIQEIYPDEHGYLWVPTWGGGLNRFDPKTGKSTRYRHNPSDPSSLSHDTIWDMDVDRAGRLWLATEMGLDCFDPRTEVFVHYRHDPENPSSLSQNKTITVMVARDGRVWVGSDSLGVSWLDPVTGQVQRLPQGEPNSEQLCFNRINHLFQDKDGDVWVGADSGASRYHAKKGVFQNFVGHTGDPKSLPSNIVWRISQDRMGNIWMATFDGVVTCRPDHERFGLYQPRNEDGTYVLDESYYQMDTFEMRYVWMSGPNGLTRFDRKTQRFQTWPPPALEAGDPRLIDLGFGSDGVLWVSQHKTLFIFDPEQGTYRPQATMPTPINRFLVNSTEGQVLLGTDNGLALLRLADGHVIWWHHLANDPNGLSADVILEVLVDKKGRKWAGTYGYGLDCLEPGAKKFKHYRHQNGNPQTIPNDSINTLMEGPDGFLWVGTRDGLARLNPERGLTTNYTTENGLSNDFINGTLFDDAGFLWISTDKGINKLDVATNEILHYGPDHGVLNVFSAGCFARLADGALAFGSEGINLFYPNEVNQEAPAAPIVLTDLLLFNQAVGLDRDGASGPLKKPLRYLDTLNLSYKDYVLAFQFAALDYSFSEKRTYEYQLEGFDQNWIKASGNRLASYTNLPGGTYTFRVKGNNYLGEANIETALQVRIHPPPWKTVYAYVLYALLGIAAFASYVRYQDRKLERERKIVARLSEVDHLKDEFLANTSHELRTPLHGMIGLAESLLDGAGGELSATARDHLLMIKSSGVRLANLVNDILDFSKLQHNSLTCNLQAVDLHSIAHVVIGLLKPLIGNKPVVLENWIPKNLDPVLADENRLQQILFNLVGNAIKFTDRGSICLEAIVDGTSVAVSVRDTGIGIPAEKTTKIFQAFEQADGSDARAHGGTGLGLAVTRKLLEIQGGKISVTSIPGQGSTFTFTLPKATPQSSFDESFRVPAIAVPADLTDLAQQVTPAASVNHKFRILIVDDDPVNRLVLLNHLSRDYNVVAVESGPAAIEAVEMYNGFDLILLDIMMPRMTGFEVCERLRLDFPAQELPVIYLTAKRRESDVVTGFETGGNDFIFKPVSKGELMMRVETHLRLLDTHRNLEAKVADRTHHLVETQKELLREAHVAGMAEIAVDVMHTVGNCLNSLGTSIHLIQESAQREAQGIQLLDRVNETIQSNATNLADFLSSDPQGSKIPQFLPRITSTLIRNQTVLAEESDKMTESLKVVTEAVRAQQQHSVLTGSKTHEQLNDLVKTVLNMSLVSQGRIETELDPKLPLVVTSRARMLRVLMCTFQNAIEAIEDLGAAGVIRIQTGRSQNKVYVMISDNGVGISAENHIKIFAYGFSTKAGNPGFGLHYCANTLKEMGCDLRVESEGPGKGTMVRIEIPESPES